MDKNKISFYILLLKTQHDVRNSGPTFKVPIGTLRRVGCEYQTNLWSNMVKCLFIMKLTLVYNPVSGKNPAHIRVPPKFLDVFRSIGSQTTYLTRVDFLTTVTFRGTTPFLTAPMSGHSPDLSQLLIEIESSQIHQNVRKMHIYISRMNIPKASETHFLRKFENLGILGYISCCIT